MANCPEPNRADCPRLCSDFCNAKEEAEARRSAATCSPSSAPETSKAWDDVSRTPDGMYDTQVNIREYAYAMLDHSRKMERERNAARDSLQEMVRIVESVRLSMTLGKTQIERLTRAKLILENA